MDKLNDRLTADLVGITITLDVMPRAVQIAAGFRDRGIPVVAGGIHVTCYPEDCQPYFDAICVGPAERVWGKIIRDAESGCLQPRYCDMQGFRGDEIASPAILRHSSYLYSNVVSTSRGCPNCCGFCYNSNENRVERYEMLVDAIHSRGIAGCTGSFTLLKILPAAFRYQRRSASRIYCSTFFIANSAGQRRRSRGPCRWSSWGNWRLKLHIRCN